MRVLAAGLACLTLGAARFLAAAPAQAGVRGVVYDSVGRRALPGAHVQFVPLDPARHSDGRRTTRSDSTGGFAVADLPPGRYLAGFFHPRLDSLGLEPPLTRIDFRAGRALTLELAVPSTESVIAGWCGRRASSDSTGVVLGFTPDAKGASTWADASVTAQWRTITIGATGARAGVQRATAGANSRGWFARCGVPRGGALLLRSTPGVNVRPIDLMTRVIRMRSTNGLEACVPVVVIDGVRVNMPDMNLDDIVPADLVRAVEIHPRRMQAPPEFQGDLCGTIAIWTGLRGWLAKQLSAAPGRSP